MIDTFITSKPSTLLDYFCLYTIPGVAIFLYLLIQKAFKKKHSDFALNITALSGKNTGLIDHLLDLGMCIFVMTCIFIGWPGLIIWYFNGKQNDAKRKIRQVLPDFECTPQYLVTQVPKNEAESLNCVFDPLGKVPTLPFGHLNRGWETFLLKKYDEYEELWLFHTPKGSKTGKYQFACTSDMRGYAKVLNGKILSEFIAEAD